MTPNLETYFKIMILALSRESLVTAFTVADFFANGGKQIIINGLVQYAGYLGSQAVGNQLTPEIVLPIVANTKLAGQFVQIPGMPPVQ